MNSRANLENVDRGKRETDKTKILDALVVQLERIVFQHADDLENYLVGQDLKDAKPMSYHNVLVSEGFLGYWLLVTSTISRDLDQSRAVEEDSRSLSLQAFVTREQPSTCWAPCVVCFAFLGRGDMSNLV